MSQSDEEVARVIAEMISDFRAEYYDSIRNALVKECDEIVESGYDPARGSGRGPWWAEGE